MNYQPKSNISHSTKDLFFKIGSNIRLQWLSDDQHFTMATNGIDLRAWQQLTDGGFWHIGLPKNKKDKHCWYRLTDAVQGLAEGCGDLGFVLSAIAHVGIIRMIHEYGNNQQKETFLPQLLQGDVAAMAITEPTGGSDVPRLKLEATPIPSGYILNGHKAHITNAPNSKVVLAVARRSDLDSKKDIFLCVVDTKQKGITIGRNEDLIGHRGSSTGDIIFSNVEISQSNILSAGSDGLRSTYEMIAFDRALYGLAASSCMIPLLDEAMDRANKRSSFGKPIKEYQLVQQRLVETNTAILTGQTFAKYAVKEFLHGNPNAMMLCSMAKLTCTEGFLTGSRNLMSIMGHAGYEKGAFSSAFCDAAGSCIAAGTSDIQQINIFKHMDTHWNVSSHSA